MSFNELSMDYVWTIHGINTITVTLTAFAVISGNLSLVKPTLCN